MSLPEAITRKEMYYAYLTGTGTNYPEPITREEQYLYYLCENGGIGGGGEPVTPEEIEAAVTKYLDENPVQAGATADEAAKIQKNADDIALLQESAIEIDDTLLKEGYAADAKEAGRRIDALAIKRTASGKTILLTDTSQMPFGLKEYGWTAQETTTGAQLLDFSGAADSTNATSGMAATVNGDGSYTLTGTALDASGNLWLMGGCYAEADNPATLFILPAGTYTITGVVLYKYTTPIGMNALGKISTFTLAEDTPITGVRNPTLTIGETYNETIYPMLNAGSTALPWEPYTGGVPSPNPDYPQELVSAGDKGSIEVSITDGADNAQSLSMLTPNGLPGIPVSSGGNYTDENGQQWIADYRDWERGVDVQMVAVTTKSAESVWAINDGFISTALEEKVERNATILCNIAKNKQYDWKYGYCTRADTRLIFGIEGSGVTNVNEWKELIRDTTIEVLYVLNTPIETPIPAEELAAYHAAHTNKPNTTVVNDEGCWMEMEYTVDTESYMAETVENKVEEGKIMTDAVTGKEYVLGMKNGLLTVWEVVG